MPHVLPHGISPLGVGDLSSLPADFTLRASCLLWGQDDPKTVENLAGLRLPNTVRGDILTITRSATAEIKAAPRDAREWRHRMGKLAIPALTVRCARQTEDAAEAAELISLVETSAAQNEPVNMADLAIGGADLLAVGFKPGRILQDVFCDLLEAVWDDPSKNSRKELIEIALKRKD